jgi:hypothetical protein
MTKGKESEETQYRFGGHQSCALRVAWLPKPAAAIEQGSDPLSDPLKGVVDLGLGKNMVEALRCGLRLTACVQDGNAVAAYARRRSDFRPHRI